MLLSSAMLLIGGQQKRTQFNQSIRDIQSKIDDMINSAQTGYYNNPGNFNCSATPSGPRFGASVTNTQGKNAGCIFLGKAMHFGVGGDEEAYSIYSVAGNRESAGSEVTSLADALPKAVHPHNSDNAADSTERGDLNYGLQARKMYYDDGARHAIGAVAFMSSFAQSGGSGLVSGSKTTDLWPVTGTGLGDDETDVVDQISSGLTVRNPSGGVVVCFEDQGTDQYGVITIGGAGRLVSTTLQILDKATAEAGVCS